MTAFTDEVDDVEYAIEEILGQLDLDGLLAESVGIVSCNHDFTETDVVRALCERLPFPVTGATTSACAVKGSKRNVAPLSILVLTSDTVRFRLGLTGDLTVENHREQIRGAWEQAAEGMEGQPSLVLTFLPLLVKVSGARQLEVLSSVAGRSPIFGTMCVTEETGFVSSGILRDGEFHKGKLSIVLLYGDVHPRFFLGTISEEKFFKSKGVISEVVDGSILKAVSGKSTRDFLLGLGLSQDEEGRILIPGLFPLAVDFNDGSAPILRAMLATQPDGSMVLAGDVPVGATLSVSTIDAEEVGRVARRTLDAVAAEKGYSAVIINSCAGRYHVAEEFDNQLEIDIVRRHLDETGRYLVSFSAGEICPVPTQCGALENRFHNFTIIACVI
jgi:hypothetical protein